MTTVFNLPVSTNVNRVVPKNSFDKYATPNQRRAFTELVDKIRWTQKCSIETINLSGKNIGEIQFFEIHLKRKSKIDDLLLLMDRAIPYHVVFSLFHKDNCYLSAAYKHSHPTNENNAVVDWTFQSDWFHLNENPFKLKLSHSLDFIFTDLCKQISGRSKEKLTLRQLVDKEQQVSQLKSEITRLESLIKKSRQFNKKVELNIQLQEKVKELASIK